MKWCVCVGVRRWVISGSVYYYEAVLVWWYRGGRC